MQSVTDFRAETSLAWADFVRDGGPDTDLCRVARPGPAVAGSPRATQLLAAMAAHVGPLPGGRGDARRVFLALRPGVDAFLDLVDGPFPKALRLVAEAGVPTWSEAEIAAGLLSLVQRCDTGAATPALVRRLLSALKAPSKIRIAEICLAHPPRSCWPHFNAASETLARVVATSTPHLDRWKAAAAAILTRRLCADVAIQIVDFATAAVDVEAIDDVRATHLGRLVDLEVRRAELAFTRDGVVSTRAFVEWVRGEDHPMANAIRLCLWTRRLDDKRACVCDVTPTENRAIQVLRVQLYGKSWTYTKRAPAPSASAAPQPQPQPEDDGVLVREMLAFVLEHRTKTPDAYRRILGSMTEIFMSSRG